MHFGENASFGLDFSSALPPNDQHELFVEKAKLFPFIKSPIIDYYVLSSNCIRTGSTRSICTNIYHEGLAVLFSGDQMIYGSYGGAEGRPVGETDGLIYGYYRIDACQQSPVVIQFQSSVPFRTNTIDGNAVVNLGLYNRYGKIPGYGCSLTRSI